MNLPYILTHFKFFHGSFWHHDEKPPAFSHNKGKPGVSSNKPQPYNTTFKGQIFSLILQIKILERQKHNSQLKLSEVIPMSR